MVKLHRLYNDFSDQIIAPPTYSEINANNKIQSSEKAFVETKEYVWRQNKDYVGGATC